MSSTLPIGIFDSGVGGLSILKKIHQLLPLESLLYIADSAHASYGPKGEAFIIERSRYILEFFNNQPVKAVVVACNTATAAAVETLRNEYSLPIIGMEPAIKPAALQTQSGVIGVLATEGTLTSDKFVDLKSRFDGKVEIITQLCPGLVEHIEQLDSDLPAIKNLLHKCIRPLVEKGADSLVLGCTHYNFIKDQIREVAGDAIAIIDTQEAVSNRLASVLKEEDLLSELEGTIYFYSSGNSEHQNKLISRYWGNNVEVEIFE
jgi:glutamate racemase